MKNTIVIIFLDILDKTNKNNYWELFIKISNHWENVFNAIRTILNRYKHKYNNY